MNCEVWVFVFLVLAICSTIWSEYHKHRSLRSVFHSRAMRLKFVNCNQYLRILKIILMISMLVMQGIFLCWQDCSNEAPNSTFFIKIFMLLAIEELIPTGRFRDIKY